MKAVLFFCLLAGFQMINAQNKADDFRLYLLPPSVKSQGLAHLDVTKIKPAGRPFLTTRDIVTYYKDSSEIVLDYLAADRLRKLKVPVSGRPFIIFVGNEPVYAGAFWTSISSQSFYGVFIDQSNAIGDFPALKIGFGYPVAPRDMGFDPRNDERIFKTFAAAGKLYEDLWITGKCRHVSAAFKHVPSHFYLFSVDSVVKSSYEFPEIEFEVAEDVDSRLIAALGAQPSSPLQKFTSSKDMLLKFEKQVGVKDPNIYLRDFETK